MPPIFYWSFQLSHTVKKKHSLSNLGILTKVCDRLGIKMMTPEQYLATCRYAYIRGSKSTLRAVVVMPSGWVGSTVEVHEGEIAYDGDNEYRQATMENLYALKRAYTEEVIRQMEEPLRCRVEVDEWAVFAGQPGTLYTFEGSF